MLKLWMAQSTPFEATEAVKAVASAIREDRHLGALVLKMEDGFTDEAGVALAEAMKVNKTLRVIRLDDTVFASDPVHNKASLGAQAYKAFSAMLRVNTSLILKLPTLDDDVGDERLLESRKQMLIEQRLSGVGRGRLLASNQSTREDWVNALQELNASNSDDRLEVSCMYSLLRLYQTFACWNSTILPTLVRKYSS
jgi:hypothetical protein